MGTLRIFSQKNFYIWIRYKTSNSYFFNPKSSLQSIIIPVFVAEEKDQKRRSRLLLKVNLTSKYSGPDLPFIKVGSFFVKSFGPIPQVWHLLESALETFWNKKIVFGGSAPRINFRLSFASSMRCEIMQELQH